MSVQRSSVIPKKQGGVLHIKGPISKEQRFLIGIHKYFRTSKFVIYCMVTLQSVVMS